MTPAAARAPGATRVCPHCHETILESASVCPACNHRLRYSDPSEVRAAAAAVPLQVEGSFRHPADAGTWEYSMVLAIRNERGEEIARRVVGVGAMQPDELRSFSVRVEISPAAQARPSDYPASSPDADDDVQSDEAPAASRT